MVAFLTWLICPLTAFVLGLFLVVLCHFLHRPKTTKWLFALSLCWLFVWGTDGVPRAMGSWLESKYPPLPMEKVPKADVILLLGGAMGAPHGACIYPEMFAGADRVWHAARLYHAGKAPVIMPTGCAEDRASVRLLKELGVPASAIRVENKAENTIGNGLYTKALMQKYGFKNALLVTSAYHMRRAEMIFKTLGVPVFPVATDHEALYGNQGAAAPLSWGSVARWLPSANMLDRSAWYLKEIFGFWGDTWRMKDVKDHGKRK